MFITVVALKYALLVSQCSYGHFHKLSVLILLPRDAMHPRYLPWACVRLSVCLCLSVCLSVTSWCSTKTAKRRITQTTPHDTPGSLVFCAKDLREIRPGSPPTRAPNAGGVGQNRLLLTNNRLYLENGTR